MLLINTIINSSILFPSCFIMRKYVDRNYALIGSIAIAVLPCLFFYNFTLMCENLLMPLFIFSIWFVHEAFRTREISWIAAAAFSVAMLFFTKHIGLAMIFGLVVSVVYYWFADQDRDRLHLRSQEMDLGIRKTVSAKSKLLFAFILAIVFLLVSMTKIENPFLGHYIQKELYDFSIYLMKFITIFGNASTLIEFLSLLLHELEYLMASSYFVIFLIAMLFLSYVLNLTRGLSLNLVYCSNQAEIRRSKVFRSVVIYFLVSSVALIIATVLFMYQMIHRLPEGYSLLYLCNRDDFQLLGRYVDPLVPAIFLFGLIGSNYASGQKKEKLSRVLLAMIIAYLAICSLFSLTFPFDANKEMFSLNYFNVLKSVMPSWAIVPVVSPVFFAGLYLSLYDRRCRSILIAIIILASIIVSAYNVPQELAASKGFQEHNQIGSYLDQFSNDSSLIIMDQEDDMRDRVMLPFTKFWARGSVVTHYAAEDPSGVYSDYAGNASYIISSKILPYPSLAYSTKGYLLYRPTRLPGNASLYGIDKTDGWYCMERWNGLPANWMKDNATLTVYSDRPLKAILSFHALSFYKSRRLQVLHNGTPVIETIVPTNPIEVHVPVDLKRGTTQLRFLAPEGCDCPCDNAELNNIDARCLSVAIENPAICERKDSISSRESNICPGWEQPQTIFVSGWHGPENWNAITTRWMQADSTVSFFSEESKDAVLVFQAQSFARPRSLEISLNASPLAKFSIGTRFENITQPIRLAKGLNLIRLSVPEGCEKPCNIPELNSSDCRCISIAVQNLNIK
ncbi:MAG: glycosyltransferase family 39 protein [Methanothrix sp.]|nr:glycosyltransferase family 39 protein [Methanothrix sp.]